MRGPIFLGTAAGFVLKSFELDAGSNVLAWSGDDGSSGTIQLLDVTDIILPQKNAGLRIHLQMNDGTTEKLIVDSYEARQQWTHDIQRICRENWSNLQAVALSVRFGYSTCFVQFCSEWFKSFHGDGSLCALDVAKFMQAISSEKAYVTVGVNVFLDHYVPRSAFSAGAASRSLPVVPIEGVFECVSELCELGYYGIAELCSLKVVNIMSLEKAVESLCGSYCGVSEGAASWLGHLLNVREAIRLSYEESISAAVGSDLLLPLLVKLLKEHSVATGSMLSVFVVFVVLECLQAAFMHATSACCSHGQLLATVARLSLCDAFYSSCALDIMSLCIVDSARSRMKALKALSFAAQASDKTLSSALVDCLLCGVDACTISVLMFSISLLKSASTATELGSFAHLLCHGGLRTAAQSARDSSSNPDVLHQLALFDECISKIPAGLISISHSLKVSLNVDNTTSCVSSSSATTCGVLVQSLTSRLDKVSTDSVKMLEEHLTLWLKLKHENYFSTFCIVNKVLDHVVRGEPIPSEVLSALKALHTEAGGGNRSGNRSQSVSESDSVIQSVVDSFWEMGSSVFGSNADADESMLKRVVEHEKLKRDHAAALQEIKFLRESIGVNLSFGKGTVMADSTHALSHGSNSQASSTHMTLTPTKPLRSAPGNTPHMPSLLKAPVETQLGLTRSSADTTDRKEEIRLKSLALQVPHIESTQLVQFF
jgi:hypothetical protein